MCEGFWNLKKKFIPSRKSGTPALGSVTNLFLCLAHPVSELTCHSGLMFDPGETLWNILHPDWGIVLYSNGPWVPNLPLISQSRSPSKGFTTNHLVPFPLFWYGNLFLGCLLFFFSKPKFKQNQNLIIYNIQISLYGCLGGSDSKIHLAMQAKTWVGSLGWEDSPGEGNGNPLKYSCLENPMDRRVWRAIVHGVTKSRTWLSNFLSLMIGTFFF